MKRTELQRRTPLTPGSKLESTSLPRRTRIRPQSAKRRGKGEQYRQAKDAVRQRAADMCELGTLVCTRRGIEPHHLKGRVGDLLCDVNWMRWTCRPCHDYVEHNRAEAYERGWLVKRNGKGP